MIAFIIPIYSRALILLESFKNKIVIVSSVDHISCPEFRMCSANIDISVEEAKSFLCSLNLIFVGVTVQLL